MVGTIPTNSQPSWSRNLIASNRSVQKASRTIRFLKDGVSGGSTDIVPEPKGMQNGTAPLQNANSSDGKDRDNFDTLQENL